METEIKRLAQFVWDNADNIAEFLNQSNRYRTVNFGFEAFVPKTRPLETELKIYDDNGGHIYLVNNEIHAAAFSRICEEMNMKTGEASMPEPVKVREKLKEV